MAPALAAVSVSGPSDRITSERVASIGPVLQAAAELVCQDLEGAGRS